MQGRMGGGNHGNIGVTFDERFAQARAAGPTASRCIVSTSLLDHLDGDGTGQVREASP
jgi:hypothetical protein